tara:strand:+ start:78 stop:257 length:180 start_codon:yes stop_codon:yes gene_type:complete
MQKKYVYSCFAETLSFAETLGWVEPEDDGRVDWGDAIESDALDFIEVSGFKVIGYEEVA